MIYATTILALTFGGADILYDGHQMEGLGLVRYYTPLFITCYLCWYVF